MQQHRSLNFNIVQMQGNCRNVIANQVTETAEKMSDNLDVFGFQPLALGNGQRDATVVPIEEVFEFQLRSDNTFVVANVARISR